MLEWGLGRGLRQPFCTRAPVFPGPGCHPRTTWSAPGNVYPLPLTLLPGRWGVGPGLRSPSWPSLAIQDPRACQPLPWAWHFISTPSILAKWAERAMPSPSSQNKYVFPNNWIDAALNDNQPMGIAHTDIMVTFPRR